MSETKTCTSCRVDQPLENFWPLKNGGRQAKCSACIKASMAAGRERGQQSAPALADAAAVLGLPLPTADEAIADEVLDAEGWIPDPPPELAHPAPSPSSAPNGTQAPRPLAELRAEQDLVTTRLARLDEERDRATDYLAKLGQEIEQAEILEAFAARTNDELRAELAEAQRRALLIEIALSGRAA